jgi:hypothetical protein
MNRIDELICSFEEEIRIQYKAKIDGDSKKNNQSVEKSHLIFKELRELNMVESLLPLLDSKYPEIRISSAFYCLPIAEKLCLYVLEEIRDGDYKILGLEAEYGIKNWLKKEYYLWE